jgi:hypothetical protein
MRPNKGLRLSERVLLSEQQAAQQDDEPVKAQELTLPKGAPSVINVRFAGYRRCSPNHGEHTE